MKLSPLTMMVKEDVRKFEHESTPIPNIRKGWGAAKHLYFTFKMLRLQGWYHKHGLPAGRAMRKQWAKLTELLGSKPTYYVTYEYRNALWGFLWRDQRVLFYKSERGISLQVAPDFPTELVIPLVKELILRLKA